MRPIRKRLPALLLLVSFLAGCSSGTSEQQPRKLKVGTVDVMRVMEGRPETTNIRLEWAAQAGNAYMELSKAEDQAQFEAIQAELVKRDEAWQKRMDGFMEESIQMVEKEATALAKERDLDIVVVDNPMTETIKYREGEDLTLDVMVKLNEK